MATAVALNPHPASAARFESLPHGVQLRIFGLLPLDSRLRCTEVCRGWRDCLQDVEAWKHIVVPADSAGPYIWYQVMRAALARTGGHLETLDVSATEFVAPRVLDALTESNNGGALRELRLGYSEFQNEEGVNAIFDLYSKLELLSVPVQWTEPFCRELFHSEPNHRDVRICTLGLDLNEMGKDELRALFTEVQSAVLQYPHTELCSLALDADSDDVDDEVLEFIMTLSEAREPPMRILGLDAFEFAEELWESSVALTAHRVLRLLRDNSLP